MHIMRNTCGFAGKAFACLTSFVLAVGLMPGVALADDGYPDVNEKVYVGPETQTTRDVGNVTVSDNPSAIYAIYAHAENEEGATAHAHGTVELTGVNDPVGANGVVAHSNSHQATVNVDGDVTVDVITTETDEYDFGGVKADAIGVGADAAVDVGGNLTTRVTSENGNKSDVTVFGIEQGTPVNPEGQRASSTVNVGGDVLVEVRDESDGSIGVATGIAAFAHDLCSTSTTVKGTVTVKGAAAIGASATSGNNDSGIGDDIVILIGQDLIAKSDVADGDAKGIESYTIDGSVIMRIGGDVTATVDNGGDKAHAVGVSASGQAGKTDILVDGTITAKTAGVSATHEAGQLEVTVWKIVSDIVGAKIEKGTRNLVEDEALEAAINYIIKIEQPNEGNILKLVGTSVKKATMADGDRSFDVSCMGQKVYLDIEDGWVITSAFNGVGEKALLDKDDQGWFVVVPNGGGVYLSAEVAKVEPAPEPTPEPEPAPAPEPDSAYDVADSLPSTGDSDTVIVALALTAFTSLMLMLIAASRMRFRQEP